MEFQSGESDQKKILLVEDDGIIAFSEKLTLEKNNFDVVLASTGEEAVALMNGRDDIDMVLMDIDLGRGIDGTAAAELILEKQEVPIVFLSGHTEKEILDKTDKITSYGYILKSAGETVLLASIKMAFRLFNATMSIRKKEKILEDNEFFFRESQKAGRIGSYKHYFESDLWEGSETLDEIYGIDSNFVRNIDSYYNKIVYPDDREKLHSAISECKKNKTPLDIQYRIIRVSDKSVRWIHSLADFRFHDDGSPFYIVGTTKDITNFKTAELKLQKNEVMLRSILDTIPQHVFWKDLNSVYLGCNMALAKSIGIPDTNSIVGKTDFDIPNFKPEAESYRADDEFVMKNNSPKFHIIEHVHSVDGEKLQIDTSKLPLYDADGNVYGMLGIYEDITDRMAAEKMIRNLLEEKNILLKEVHHRLKNNVAMISGFLALQLQDASDSTSRNVFEALTGRIKSLQILYECLLMSDDYEQLSVQEYFDKLITVIFDIYGDSDRISIHKEIDNFSVTTRKLTTLGLIVNEVISNALKYAYAGRGKGVLTVEVRTCGEVISVLIRDDGVGFNREQKCPEKGLGLTLIEMLVSQLGGTYSIRQNNGTEFSMECGF